MNVRSSTRWALVAALVIAAIGYAAVGFDWSEYVFAWVGTVFKALCGGAIGWAVSRYVCRLDISSIRPSDRPVAALSQAILIAGFANAVAAGF